MLSLSVALYAFVALLFGWGLEITGLVRHSLTQTAMVPATALSFVLASLSLITALRGRGQLSLLLNGLLLGLVGITVIGQVFGWAGPASLFFAETGETERMALITALTFVLYVWSVHRLMNRAFFTVECIGVFGISGAIAIALMKLSGVTHLPGLSYASGISLQTAILAALLFLALSIAASDSERDRAD